MKTQTKEAARQILGCVSDIHAVVSLTGMTEVSLKLADIREKAAFLLEDKKGPEDIIQGYADEATEAMRILSEVLAGYSRDCHMLEDEELLLLVRVADIFITRSRVYMERKQRWTGGE